MIDEVPNDENVNDAEQGLGEDQPLEEPLVLEGANEVTEQEKQDHGQKALGDLPGFHVYRTDNGDHLAVFQTRESAEHFIRGHLNPQEIIAEVRETAAH